MINGFLSYHLLNPVDFPPMWASWMMGIGCVELGRWTMDMTGVRNLELFIGIKGGALGLRLLKLVRWRWVGVEGAWEAVVMFYHDWEWECAMELLGLCMSLKTQANLINIGEILHVIVSSVGAKLDMCVMLGVEVWATSSVVSIIDCCG